MTFKTSLFKSFSKALIFSDIKRFWWVGALYTLVLFFILPFNHMLKHLPLQEEWAKQALKNSLKLNQNALASFLICTIPVLLAVLLFSYLQSVKSTAAMHSLPLSRMVQYMSHSASGVILFVLPVLINGLTLIILQAATGLKEYYSIKDIFIWAGTTLLFEVLFYSFAVFVGMFTGSSIAQLVFTYILNLLPGGLYLLLTYNLSHLLYGFGGGQDTILIEKFIPIIALLSGRSDISPISDVNIMFYLLFTFLFLTAAALIYKLRHLESASDIISFPVVRSLFKYGVTICACLLGGAYFGSSSGGSFPFIILGYLLGSLLGYCIAEILLQKSFRILKAYKGFLVYSLVIAAVLIGISMDVAGYVHRVPSADQVQRVYVGYSLDEWAYFEEGKDSGYLKARYPEGYGAQDTRFFYKSEENIKNVTQLHRQLINQPHNTSGSQHFIIYTLKNGSHLIREYYWDEKLNQYPSMLKPIYESEEYKLIRFPILKQKADEIKMIDIRDSRTPKKLMPITKKDEIAEFTKLLQQDIRSSAFDAITYPENDQVIINIMDFNEKSVHYEFKGSYTKSINWLKEKGYYDEFILLPNEVEFVELEKYDPRNSNINNSAVMPKKVVIKDTKIIEQLLKVHSYPDYSKIAARITFYVKGVPGYYTFQGFLDIDSQEADLIRDSLKQLDN